LGGCPLFLFVRDQHDAARSPDPLDELVTQLLECGGVLSQIIGRMIEFQAAGRSAPDAAPKPEAAHSLIRDVLNGVGKRHCKRDIRMAAQIIAEATEPMCDNIIYAGPELS
jgi:hypothetical protein